MENGSSEAKMELNTILEDNDDEDADDEEGVEGKVTVEVDKSRLTYQGSRTFTYDDESKANNKH